MIKVEISRQALEDLIGLGIDQVLTSDQEALCLEGLEMIAALRNQAAGRIIVLPGGWLTERNVRKIVHATRVSEVHLSARSSVESSMGYRHRRVFMGGALRPSEFAWKATDEGIVRQVVEALRG
jgi:copper homeostasis protein